MRRQKHRAQEGEEKEKADNGTAEAQEGEVEEKAEADGRTRGSRREDRRRGKNQKRRRNQGHTRNVGDSSEGRERAPEPTQSSSDWLILCNDASRNTAKQNAGGQERLETMTTLSR